MVLQIHEKKSSVKPAQNKNMFPDTRKANLNTAATRDDNIWKDDCMNNSDDNMDVE